MPHIDRRMALEAIGNMISLHDNLKEEFSSWGMDFSKNSGRRNIVLSQAQEEFFARALENKYDEVISDGRTGQPDIVIKHKGSRHEIECKLTTRTNSGSISLQTDYKTLGQKTSLDYLYVVACDEFRRFAVLYFHDLTVDDFRVPSPGSRSKAAMYKHKAFHKCVPLMGGFECLNDIHIAKIRGDLASGELSPHQVRKKKKSLEYWENDPGKYTINLEEYRGESHA